jgi:hypothetical protein
MLSHYSLPITLNPILPSRLLKSFSREKEKAQLISGLPDGQDRDNMLRVAKASQYGTLQSDAAGSSIYHSSFS